MEEELLVVIIKGSGLLLLQGQYLGHLQVQYSTLHYTTLHYTTLHRNSGGEHSDVCHLEHCVHQARINYFPVAMIYIW